MGKLKYAGDGFSIEILGDPQYRVVITGSVSIPEAAPLNRFFDGVHAEVLTMKPAEVLVDVRNLEFMNSTGFKPLIYWIDRVNNEKTTEQYPVRFLSSPERRWQRAFLSAVSCFAPTLVTVEEAA